MGRLEIPGVDVGWRFGTLVRRGAPGALVVVLTGLGTSPAPAGQQDTSYARCFDLVWNTVNETFFDPTFGGVDWKAVGGRYKPQIIAAPSDEQFYRLLNEMLFELRVSHLGVIPPGETWAQIEPTLFAESGIGLDVRMLDDDIVVTSVAAGSPADRVGIRPSFVITKIDGETIAAIKRERLSLLEPPFNVRNSVASEVLARLYGRSGSHVSVSYVDADGRGREVTLGRQERTLYPIEGVALPPVFIKFDQRRLSRGIGYIRFNTFMPAVAERLFEAIRKFHNSPGLIIDLRGNPGGHRSLITEVAGQCMAEEVMFLKLKTRSGTEAVRVQPVAGPFTGPVVVLVDVMSKSAAEAFAAGMQATGRAWIVGETTPGSIGPANPMPLPNGAMLVYPYAQCVRPDGSVIEGRGVTPDVEVKLDRSSLAQGRDVQLEAAVRRIIDAIPP
jgi:carboxyl-terminal processing protease